MKTKRNINLLTAGVIVITCFVSVWLTGSIQGSEKTYEIRPEITLPENRTDAARAIDAYERLMDRLMDLTQRNLTGVNTDIKGIAEQLFSIDSKLTELSKRIARIEKALGIEEAEKPVEKGLEDKPSAAVDEDSKSEPQSRE